MAAAIARYVCQEGEPERGLIIGYDTRFLSAEAAREAARQVAAEGVPVLLADRATPTPAVSYAVVARKTAGALMVTASHNPYIWNGIKLKAPYGGSASPDIMKQVEKYVPAEAPGNERTSNAQAGEIETADLIGPYLDRIKKLVSLDRIRESGRKFVIDPMFGAARGCLARVFEDAGISFSEIHGEHNPLFPGLNPEPIDPHLADLSEAVVKSGSDSSGA